MVQINQYEPVYGKEEAQAVYDYIINGGWCSEFGKTKELTEMIRQYTGAKYALIVNNGTAALQIAVMATRPSGIALCPAYTMPATAYAASLCGMQIRFADVSKENYCIDNEQMLNYGISSSIVLPVNINGRATYTKDDIKLININTFVIEDACQAMGSRNNGSHIGTFGNVGVLSLNVFKLISTGQGGILLTDDEQLYLKMKKIKDFGRAGSRGSEYEMIGMNAKFNDLLAVIGIEQFKKIEEKRKAKQLLWLWYEERLHDIPQVTMPNTDVINCAPWYIDPLVESRNELIEYLKIQGIESQPFYQSLHRLKCYSGLGYTDKNFPNASYIADHGIWLPSSTNLTEDTVDMICDYIQRFYSK